MKEYPYPSFYTLLILTPVSYKYGFCQVINFGKVFFQGLTDQVADVADALVLGRKLLGLPSARFLSSAMKRYFT